MNETVASYRYSYMHRMYIATYIITAIYINTIQISMCTILSFIIHLRTYVGIYQLDKLYSNSTFRL